MISKNFDKLIHDFESDKFAHAYLIETNNQDFCVEELKYLVKHLSCLDNFSPDCDKCSICKMIDNDEALNLFIVGPDGMFIKKEQILELKKKCLVKPDLAKNNVYIIKQTEKLNSSSANTMLKFVEEPYDNTIGFFITNNKENVINTIKSRCQILSVKYDNATIYQELGISKEEFDFHVDNIRYYLLEIINNKNDSILINKTILNDIYLEKNQAYILFKIVLDIYDSVFYYICGKNVIKYDGFEKLYEENLEYVVKIKEILVKLLNDMNYNAKIDLLFDRFVIEMGEVND